MKLSQWAKDQGLSYKTAYRMFKAGKLPVHSEQLETGTILVYPEQQSENMTLSLEKRVEVLEKEVLRIKKEVKIE